MRMKDEVDIGLDNGDIVHNEHAGRESFPRFWLLVEDYTRVNLVSSE
jgi:hypothetical protein